ncbi:MAG TPA: zf-HC2 domain-containing protein [Vicinamibacterales bacterium]|nr:zf-HC2 domain-containing protein [Vicinamibacterales bacterium]
MTDQTIPGCGDLDEQITPYIDGEAAPETRRPVDAHLSRCAPCRERVAEERAARDLVRAQAGELRTAVPDGLRARCQSQRLARTPPARVSRAWRWVPLSMAATLLLAIAGAFVFTTAAHDQALAAGLALDHIKCFELRPTVHGAVDASALARAWQRRHGWALTVPPSAPDEHLRLLTARRCLSTDGGVAHLMYLWDGQPLSVYVLPKVVSHDALIDTLGHEAVIWSANGRTYAVLADGHPSGLEELVRYVKANAR